MNPHSGANPGSTVDTATRPAGTPAGDLAGFEGSGEAFVRELLMAQLRIGGPSADAAALLARTGAQEMDLLGSVPPTDESPPAWVRESGAAIDAAAMRGRAVAGVVDGSTALVAVPLPGLSALGARGGVALYRLRTSDPLELDAARDRLEAAAGMLMLLDLRLAQAAREDEVAALRSALETASLAGAHPRFRAVAMALVNEIGSRLGARRVTLGLLEGRYVRAVAVSNTERFVRTSDLVREIESAMDEAIDQDTDVHFPHEPEEAFVARQSGELARKHGPSEILVLPMRYARAEDGPAAVGALLIERDPGGAVEVGDRQWVRLALNLVTPRLVELHEREAWIGRRAARSLRRGLAAAVSPRHSAWKLGAVAAAIGIGAMVLIDVDRTARGTFAAEARTRRAVSAPFEGVVRRVPVKVGEPVVSGVTVLAEMDATELRLKLAEARAQEAAALRQADAAQASGDPSGTGLADALVARAAADEARARAELLELQIGRAVLLAPIDGVVIAADAERVEGAPLRTGDMVVEVAGVGPPVIVLAVPDSDIAGIEPGQTGEIAAAGAPDRRLEFRVESIDPVSSVEAGRNVFHVRGRLTADAPEWLRPGMEGAGFVRTGRTSLLNSWTRDAADWVRLRMWW